MKTSRFFGGNGAHRVVLVPAKGASGGLALLWDEDRVNVLEVLKGDYSVTMKCSLKNSNIVWMCSNVYGPSKQEEKQCFWAELRAIESLWSAPWLIFGDFNEIRKLGERKGSSASRRERRDFNAFIDDHNLVEFAKEGPKFSFSNNQEVLVQSKLDRFLASSDWLELFSGHAKRSLGFYHSDHRAILLEHKVSLDGGPKPFLIGFKRKNNAKFGGVVAKLKF